MMRYILESPEVLYSPAPLCFVDDADIAHLVKLASGNPRKRVRLCAHPDTDDALHEMLIVHACGNYVPPHRHLRKSESFHMIEGELDVVIFADDGTVNQVISLSSSGGGKAFFYRLSRPLYHSVVARSAFAVFHETTNGPFKREELQFAPWAPTDAAPPSEIAAYVAELEERITRIEPAA